MQDKNYLFTAGDQIRDSDSHCHIAIVMREFLVALKGYLDRRHIVNLQSIQSGQEGITKVSAFVGKRVTVLRIESDYNLVLQLGDGRTLRCHPGQFEEKMEFRPTTGQALKTTGRPTT